MRFYGICITFINLTNSEFILSSLEQFHERSILLITQQVLYTIIIVVTVRSASDYMWVPASILLSSLPTNLAGWIFVRREAFTGFPEIALMEDIEFSRAMKRVGRPACLRERVSTSGRRWESRGVVRTILLMWRLRFLYALVVAPQRLAREYADQR